ncbi:MAG TPA: ABC transporter permease [Pseudothermotoga sp.]
MRIFKLSKAFFLNDIREFSGFFWPFIFPLILFFILVSVFSGTSSNDGGITFRLGIVKEEDFAGFGKILEQVIEKIQPEPFQITVFEDLDEAQKNLQLKKIDLVLRIPKGLNISMARVMLFSGNPAKIELYTLANSYESQIASKILQSILQQVDLEMSKQAILRSGGEYKVVDFTVKPIEGQTHSNRFHYPTYVFPAILLMSIMSGALFSLPLGLIYNREQAINKRLYTTPTNSFDYLLSLGMSLFASMALSCVLIYVMGLTVYKISALCLSIEFILKLLYSIAVCFSLGIVVVSFCRKFTTALVITQIAYQILMFLGGFYFPVLNFNMPQLIKIVARILPTTYLVENLRYSLGIHLYSFSQMELWFIPGLWIIGSIAAFSLNFKRVMGYE